MSTTTANTHVPALDSQMYPHIIDRVLASLSYPELYTFRLTSSSYRDQIDRLLLTHVLLSVAPEGRLKLRSPRPPFQGLPFIYRPGYMVDGEPTTTLPEPAHAIAVASTTRQLGYIRVLDLGNVGLDPHRDSRRMFVERDERPFLLVDADELTDDFAGRLQVVRRTGFARYDLESDLCAPVLVDWIELGTHTRQKRGVVFTDAPTRPAIQTYVLHLRFGASSSPQRLYQCTFGSTLFGYPIPDILVVVDPYNDANDNDLEPNIGDPTDAEQEEEAEENTSANPRSRVGLLEDYVGFAASVLVRGGNLTFVGVELLHPHALGFPSHFTPDETVAAFTNIVEWRVHNSSQFGSLEPFAHIMYSDLVEYGLPDLPFGPVSRADWHELVSTITFKNPAEEIRRGLRVVTRDEWRASLPEGSYLDERPDYQPPPPPECVPVMELDPVTGLMVPIEYDDEGDQYGNFGVVE
ncbi:uncharacterized protein EHS24_002356 [Apiotrichum porosum]|uniref:Uncharacterized protein n=1 Tax=Apiotrichum porosum TaxID=105984 RepID=A0A427XIR3_9TREE|nr:uncharacterized protein EHS24_002356 [Apiotrichum porosum]RSH78627.1 hypothetical protein EHS24_002356 [Apiotrichum porosum]